MTVQVHLFSTVYTHDLTLFVSPKQAFICGSERYCQSKSVCCNKGVTIGILNRGDVASIPASRRRTESFCDSLRRPAMMVPAEPAPTAMKLENIIVGTLLQTHFLMQSVVLAQCTM